MNSVVIYVVTVVISASVTYLVICVEKRQLLLFSCGYPLFEEKAYSNSIKITCILGLFNFVTVLLHVL